MVLQYSPVLLLGLPPVVEAEHDGEGAGGQQLLVVVVVEAVSCCYGKSVANLRKKNNSQHTYLAPKLPWQHEA